MTTATLTSKGQITIPADVRRVLNAQTGDRVEFVQIEPGRFELVAATQSVRELKGLFGRAEQVTQALKRYRANGADFADALIERLSAAAGCSATMTFDADAAKVAGMTLVRLSAWKSTSRKPFRSCCW